MERISKVRDVTTTFGSERVIEGGLLLLLLAFWLALARHGGGAASVSVGHAARGEGAA